MPGTISTPPPHYGFRQNCTCMHPRKKMGMMHMTFFWGHNAEVLFDRWPGTDPKMYAVSLAFVFAMAALVELLSCCKLIGRAGSDCNFAAGIFRTVLYTVRCGLNYMVMLAVMSFNGGVFLAAVGGHALGFLAFGYRACKKSGGVGSVKERTDLPPTNC
ncbi:copper transporter 6-like [Rhodamnia argentea]|uniref:Copper transport protein n=1 Tax=Rhodamnia argentea TaxID=178133 RepID=A0A8B8NGW0_9MYRT|nr:copper transporter 6-like [Rhodamnia argentea]